MKLQPLLLCLLILFSSIAPAMALTQVTRNDVTSWNIAATNGTNCIASLEFNDLDPNHDVNMIFNHYGEIFTLDITCVKTWGYWNYNISLTYPNGTTVSENLKSFQPFATDADIKVQSYWQTVDNVLDSILDVDVYVGLMPLTASFGDVALPDYTDIAFSQVSGTSSVPGDLLVFLVNKEEFEEQVSDDPLGALYGLADSIFAWAWSSVVTWLSQVPGIGPYIVPTLNFAGILVDDLLWYANLLFIEYPETTLMSIEFYIIASVIVKTKRRANLAVMLDRIVQKHVAVIEFFYGLLLGVFNMISGLLSAIANIVNSLKP